MRRDTASPRLSSLCPGEAHGWVRRGGCPYRLLPTERRDAAEAGRERERARLEADAGRARMFASAMVLARYSTMEAGSMPLYALR